MDADGINCGRDSRGRERTEDYNEFELTEEYRGRNGQSSRQLKILVQDPEIGWCWRQRDGKHCGSQGLDVSRTVQSVILEEGSVPGSRHLRGEH